MQIRPVIYKILANRDFTVTDNLISQLFVVTFVHPTYVQIAFIWGFTVQFSLWKLVHWLWRYKLNEVCDTLFKEQKIAIISIGQRYKSTEGRQNHSIELEITYSRRILFMDIGKAKNNYNKEGKLIQ